MKVMSNKAVVCAVFFMCGGCSALGGLKQSDGITEEETAVQAEMNQYFAQGTAVRQTTPMTVDAMSGPQKDARPLPQTIDVPEIYPPQLPQSKAVSPNAYLKIDERSYGVQEKRIISANHEPRYRIYQYMPESSRSQATESQLSDISKEVAGKVYYELREDGEKNYSSRIAVVAAVPLSDLKRDTEFGRVLAEYMLTDLADRGLKVTELRLGKEINIIAQTGEFILTQNRGELANIAPKLDYVVVTTFSNTRKTLIIQGRMVSLQNGLVKTSWRYSMPITKDLLSLFQGGERPLTIAVRGISTGSGS